MTHRIKLFFAMTAMAVGPAVFAGPADAQTNARALLQAADQAVGASKVNSMQFTGKGRYAYLGQNFTPNDDWNRVDLQSYSLTIDYPSKSYKEEQVRVQGNNPRIGGGVRRADFVAKVEGEPGNRVQEAGVDGLEIHAAHTYILAGFLSAYQSSPWLLAARAATSARWSTCCARARRPTRWCCPRSSPPARSRPARRPGGRMRSFRPSSR